MKIIKNILFTGLLLSGAVFACQDGPARKKQRVTSEQERKLRAAAVVSEAGIQDTLVRCINRDPANVVKSYLGWEDTYKESHDIRRMLTFNYESSRFIECCALERDAHGDLMVYIATDDMYRYNPKTRSMSGVKAPCTYMDQPKRFDYVSNSWVPDVSAGPIEKSQPIRGLVPLSSESFVVHSADQIVLVNKEGCQEIFALSDREPRLYISSVSGAINKHGYPVLFCTVSSDVKKDKEDAKPTLKLIVSPFGRIGAFVSSSRLSYMNGACVGKSRNGDSIAYQIINDSMAVFSLETGALETTFRLNPKLLGAYKGFYCSANDKGQVAVGNGTTGCVCMYDETGKLIKECLVPRLCSIDLTNKECCVVADDQGVLHSFVGKSDQDQVIGAISPCQKGLQLISKALQPMIVSAYRGNSATIATINKEAVLDLFVHQADAIEEYDRKLQEAAQKS